MARCSSLQIFPQTALLKTPTLRSRSPLFHRTGRSMKHSTLRLLSQWFCLQFPPQIWSDYNQYGEIWWHIYNPNTGEQIRLASTAEVQMWLAQYLASGT